MLVEESSPSSDDIFNSPLASIFNRSETISLIKERFNSALTTSTRIVVVTLSSLVMERSCPLPIASKICAFKMPRSIVSFFQIELSVNERLVLSLPVDSKNEILPSPSSQEFTKSPVLSCQPCPAKSR